MEFQSFTVHDVNPGDVWFMDHPRRIVKIGEKFTLRVFNPRENRTENQPAVRCTATLADKEIPGVVDEYAAANNTRFLKAMRDSCAREGHPDDRAWEEVWAERDVPPVRKGKLGDSFIDDKAPSIPQSYVYEEIGRHPNRGGRKETQPGGTVRWHGGSSSARGSELRGILIPESDVPLGMFGKEKEDAGEERAPEVVPINAVPPPVVPEVFPRQIGSLRHIAKSLEVDISDIKGKGAVDRILVRLGEAGCEKAKESITATARARAS